MSSKPKSVLPTTNPSNQNAGEQKARRSTKTAHKLKVLPEQPAPPTQSNVPSDNEGNDDDDDATMRSDDDEPPQSSARRKSSDTEYDAEVRVTTHRMTAYMLNTHRFA